MLQMTSISIDLRSRQQQIDSMRAELQKSGKVAAAQRQQNEDATENLMEQLAIAQSVTAETQVSHLLLAAALLAVNAGQLHNASPETCMLH